MERNEKLSSRDAAALMVHHIASVAAQDVDEIMSDYDEKLVAINNLDGTQRLIEGTEPLREQVEEMISAVKANPQSGEPAVEPTILLYRGEGDYMVSSGYFGDLVLFEAYTYVARKGMARYVTGFSRKAHQLPPEVIPVKKDNASLQLTETMLQAFEKRDLDGIMECFSEDAKILTNLTENSLNGQEQIRAFYDGMLRDKANPRKSKPRYSLYEALQELVYFVYENEQGITEETYLTENGKIIFASIVNRDFVETGRL